jgi:hypothetical protein
MTPDEGLAVTTIFWGLAAIASLSIAVPQSVLLCRTTLRRDDLWRFRVKTVLLFGGLALANLRNLAVWVDYAFSDQRYLGGIEQRWPLDLAVAVILMAACTLAAVLFWQTQHEESRP